MAKNAFTAIDLFSGVGGLTVGLKLAGFRILGAAEKDTAAASIYKTNHRTPTVWQIDICKLRAKDVMRSLKLRGGELDLLAGCPPCQGFSALRTKNGAKRNRDPQNALIHEMLRFVRVLQPKAVMMENVPGLRNKKAFREFCQGLTRLKYDVRWTVKDAAAFGVPQRRRRLILLAGRGFLIPFAEESTQFVTVRQAIAHLQKPGNTGDPLHDAPENRSRKVRQIIRDIPKDGGSRSDLPKNRQLSCHQRFDGFKDVYGRIAWDSVASTITGGCFNPSKGRFLHPEQNRAITLREAALLQSFPSTYRFKMSAGKEAIAQMIGNALPPELVRKHAMEIRKALKRLLKQGGRNDKDRDREPSTRRTNS